MTDEIKKHEMMLDKLKEMKSILNEENYKMFDDLINVNKKVIEDLKREGEKND